jgi:hypothetical protein
LRLPLLAGLRLPLPALLLPARLLAAARLALRLGARLRLAALTGLIGLAGGRLGIRRGRLFGLCSRQQETHHRDELHR